MAPWRENGLGDFLLERKRADSVGGGRTSRGWEGLGIIWLDANVSG